MHYCIGDVHGCFDELMAIVDKIEKKDPDPHIILMGDLIDQGPKIYETLSFAMKNVKPDGEFMCLRGNHEEEVLNWYRKYLEWQNESVHSLYPPVSKYDFYTKMKNENGMTEEKLDEVVNFFHSLPYSYELSIPIPLHNGHRRIHYYLAHAWYSVSAGKDSERQRWINLYGRSCEGISDSEMKKYELENPDEEPVVVCGHTPTVSAVFISSKTDVEGSNRPGLIGYRPHAIFADGGCFHYGEVLQFPCMLCGICLETLEEFYPCSVEERMGRLKNSLEETSESIEYYKLYKEEYLSTPNPYRQELLSLLGNHQGDVK